MIKTMQVFDTGVLTVGTPVLLTAKEYHNPLNMGRGDTLAGVVYSVDPMTVKIAGVSKGPHGERGATNYVIPIADVVTCNLTIEHLYTLEEAKRKLGKGIDL